LITVHQPNDEFLSLVEKLSMFPDPKIILVDDGSTGDGQKQIESIEERCPYVEILRHAIHLGKSQSLRTGFNLYLNKYSRSSVGVVTVDGDSQWEIGDIRKVYLNLQAQPDSFILGTYDSEEKGNPVTKLLHRVVGLILYLLTNVKLKQNHTDLSGIPTRIIVDLLRLSTVGDDYGLEMLMFVSKNQYRITEIPLEKGKKAPSQASPIRFMVNSTKIIFVFLRYSLLSLTTAAVDFVIFSLSFYFLDHIFISILLARIVAGIFQFIGGKFIVFKSYRSGFGEVVKYVLLVLGLMLLSYGVITPLVIFLHMSPYLAKVVAEATIFLLSFAAQRLFVFPTSNNEDSTDWDSYYDKPVKVSAISRKVTQKKILALIHKYHTSPLNSICELGGGNSCFYATLHYEFPNAKYTIIDNNDHGLDLFRQHNNDQCISLVTDDVINPTSLLEPSDLVFSIGLIEHFSKLDTAKAIKYHFLNAKPGSTVIISYPTPTWLYIAARSIVELFGMWKFHDERPLSKQEVLNEVRRYGIVENYSVNWPIIFTQGVFVVKAISSKENIDSQESLIEK